MSYRIVFGRLSRRADYTPMEINDFSNCPPTVAKVLVSSSTTLSLSATNAEIGLLETSISCRRWTSATLSTELDDQCDKLAVDRRRYVNLVHRRRSSNALSIQQSWQHIATIDLPVSLCPGKHTLTHTRLTALLSGTPWVSRYQKGETNLDFTEARDSEWQWQWQLTTPAPHHSVFYRPGALPDARPTASKHWR